MKRLIIYEFKRIIRSKVTISVMLIGVVLVTLSFLGSIYSEAPDRYQTDNKRIEYGVITNEKVREELNYLRKNYTTPENIHSIDPGKEMETALTKDVYLNYYLPRKNYFGWIRENYLGFQFNGGHKFEKLMANDEYIEDFYKVRERHAISKIKYDKDMKYNLGEMEYLTGLAKKSSGPYHYGEADGYAYALTFLAALPVILLVISISVGSTYSLDYETGAAEIITASMHGKMHLSIAKIVSALIFASVSIILISVIFLLILFGKYSFYGGELPIQALDTGFVFPFTFRELLIKNMAAVFLATLTTALGSVFLSRITKRTYVVYGALLSAYLAGRYVSGIWAGGNTLLGKLMELYPFNAASYQHLIVRVYSLFDGYYNYYEVYPVFYAICIAALIIIILMLSKGELITANEKFTLMNIFTKKV